MNVCVLCKIAVAAFAEADSEFDVFNAAFALWSVHIGSLIGAFVNYCRGPSFTIYRAYLNQ